MSATPKTRKPHKSGGIPRAQTNPILFLTGIFFFNMLSRLGLAPLLPGIETDLVMNHSQAGGLFFLISSGYCISLFGSIFLTPCSLGVNQRDSRKSILSRLFTRSSVSAENISKVMVSL
jgi:hypothetical protein